jgi:hypothetical protein
MDMNDSEILVRLKEKQGFNKKEEIFELDKFINKFIDIDQYDDPLYTEMFKYLIENRLNIIKEE